MLLEHPDGHTELMHTEPPAMYEDVERFLWRLQSPLLGDQIGRVEGKRVKSALMVQVAG